uniref:Sperm microtubule inner protein 1 C-terminal domain-containing protein n=1 Tax=Heliothis virescens TaxID=7102 RepID=A0A2A4K2X3_HELVI
MPPLDLTNPDIMRFFIENYEKASRLRLRWNHLHGEKLAQAATLNRDAKGYFVTDVLKETMAAGINTITRDSISGAQNRRKKPIRDGTHIPAVADMRKGHSIVDVGLGDPKKDPRLSRPDTDLTIDPIMRPIDPKQKQLIYKGLPHFGRLAYIKQRNRIAPEDKYYFRESSGWTYGWRLADSCFGRHAPTFGRIWLLTRDTASRSGPQPDPDHYKAVELPGPRKCP